MEVFLQGLIMGFAYVAPIGMQNIFLINSALTNNLRRALLTALIVMGFDMSLALACFSGVGLAMQRYDRLQMLILPLGSLIILYIGVGLLRAKPTELAVEGTASSLRATVISSCVVTWLNPQALIDGTMMLGAFRATLSEAAAVPFISGVCSASGAWFFLLTLLVYACKSRLNGKILRALNVVCGIIIIFYGLKLLGNFVAML